MKGYNYYSDRQLGKNIAWYLPRPKRGKYKGGMPLYAEEWCLQLARDMLTNPNASVLNIFCGMNREGFRVDIRKEVDPDLVCDVHELSNHIKQKFDIIFADPPYSDEEAEELYGTPKLDYKLWTSEATKVLTERGILIVYHKHLVPNPDPRIYTVARRVVVLNRVFHPPRVAVYFQKKEKKKLLLDVEDTRGKRVKNKVPENLREIWS